MNLATLVRCSALIIIKQVPIFAVCSDTFKLYQEEKFKLFLDEVQKGTASLNTKVFNEHDILHNAYLTQLALLKIRQNEKIKLLANLFASYFNKITDDVSKRNDYNDDYELFINIIEQINMNEWKLLIILYDFELKNELVNKKTDSNVLTIISSYWDNFLTEVKSQLNFDKLYVEAVLTKLNGTGLYQTINGMYLGYLGNKGNLTPIFYKLVGFL